MGAVAPCVRNACNRRRMAESVPGDRRCWSPNRPRTCGTGRPVRWNAWRCPASRLNPGPLSLADLHHAVADLVDRLFPADPLPLAAFLLHRIFQAAFAMGMLAHRGALGAMGAEVEGAVPAGLLPDPDAIIDFGHDRAADRTMRADRLDGLDRAGGSLLCAGLPHRAARGADGGEPADGQTRPAPGRTAGPPRASATPVRTGTRWAVP